MSSRHSLCKESIRQLCLEAGACAVGFARVETLPEEANRRFEQWLTSGRNAGMAYMANYADIRSNPDLLLPGAKTLISCAFAYSTPGIRRHPLFADYAVGSDYHEVLRKALTPVAERLNDESVGTRICIDTAPLRERFWAVRAGVGFMGLNNMLIVPGVGSRVFLAEILWTGDVEPDISRENESCEGCGACMRACPGGALDGTGSVDASRCMSYLTIEHRGALPADLRLPGRIYGCDVCQDVCPHNRNTREVTVLDSLLPRDSVMALTYDDIATMEQADFSRIFSHSAVKRAKLEGLKRNAKAKG